MGSHYKVRLGAAGKRGQPFRPFRGIFHKILYQTIIDIQYKVNTEKTAMNQSNAFFCISLSFKGFEAPTGVSVDD